MVFLAVVIAASAAGCGGLSEASTQSCSQGKAVAAQANSYLVGPPELMVQMAGLLPRKFDEYAAKADDEDVKTALADLSKTFADFKPDMSKRPTALRRDLEFDRYIDQFKAAVKDNAGKLETACA